MNNEINFATYNKICVIGAPGSGKTYFATVLSRHLKRPLIAFDELRFAPLRIGEQQNSATICARQLTQAIKKNQQWITEGTAWQPWTEKAIASADIVLVMQQGRLRCALRILGRWVRNNRYHRNLKSTLKLIRVSWTYNKKRLPVILARAATYKKTVYFISPSSRDNQNRKWHIL